VQPIPSTRVNDVAADSLASHGRSAASWGAIFAGAVVAVSAFLVLLTLGAGIDFASISPWAGQGVSSTTFNVMTAVWLIVTQWISAALGGYVAGRLRTPWVGTHTHEVFFRDTAHGLLTWSLATVVVAAIAGSSISSLVSGGAHAAAQLAAGGANGAMSDASGPSTAYDVDRLFRSSTATSSGDARAEAGYIFANAVRTGHVPDADRTYLASMIAQKTGVAQDDAQKRVDEAIARIDEAKAKAIQAANKARKAAAETAIYTALSMLIGAFIASVAAALGGHLRDEHI
jgi:hypothetical protein